MSMSAAVATFCTGRGPCGHEVLLEGMEDPLTQQRKFCTAIHHTLDQFNFRDLALDLPITQGKS